MYTAKHLIPALLLTLLAACGKTPTPAPAPTPPAPPSVGSTGGRNFIAFITASNPTPEDPAFQTGADKAHSEFKIGPDGKPIVDLLLKSPEKSDHPNPNAQLDLAQPLLDQGVAAIIIEPDNQQVLDAILKAAKASLAHPPIIAINTPLDTSACQSTLNPDNANIGKLAANELATRLEGKSRILIFSDVHDPAAAAREKSFRDTASAFVMKDPADTFEIVPPDETALDVTFFSKLAAKDPHGTVTTPPSLSAVFAPDESSALTCIAALDALPKDALPKKIQILAVGDSAPLITALKEKKLTALILTDPQALAHQSVKTAYDIMREKKVPKEILIAPHLATLENFTSPEIAPLLPKPE